MSTKFWYFLLIAAAVSAEKPPALADGVKKADQNLKIFQVYRIYPENKQQLQYLLDLFNDATEFDLDFWKAPRRVNGSVDVMIPPRLVDIFHKILEDKDIHNYQIIIPDVEKLIDERQKQSKLRKQSFGPRLRDEVEEEDNIRAYYDFRTYGDYQDMVDYMKKVAEFYPSFTKLITIGYSNEQRPLYALKIGFPIKETDKKIVWFDGGIHAREWAAPHTALYFIHKLVSRYGVEPQVTHYVDNLNWYIAPILNPDGYEHTRSGNNPNVDQGTPKMPVRLWRKNRSAEKKVRSRWGREKRCRGVDLNRNFDFHWAETGSSKDPCSEVYHGSAPFSEPESRAVHDFLMQENIRSKVDGFITLHTYSQIWIHPFGHKVLDYPGDVDELVRVGQKSADALKSLYGTEYVVGSGADTLYPASGGSDDWAKDKLGAKYVYLLELRPDEEEWDGFILAENQLIPTARETWAGVSVVVDEVLKRNGIKSWTELREEERRRELARSRVIEPRRGRLVTGLRQSSGSGVENSKVKPPPLPPTTAAPTTKAPEATAAEAIPCLDLRYNCARWVKNNPRLCGSVSFFMREQCALSCGYC